MKRLLALSLLVVFASCTKKQEFKDRQVTRPIVAEVKGFDPAFASDLYSGEQVGMIFEGLLQYSYLKRPYVLEPNLAEAMPEVSKDGLTYTFKVKKGVMFQDDAAFPGGKGRELVAEDFVYSIKRIADPKIQSDGWWVLDGKIKGLNEWRDKNANAATVDYSQVVEGLKALDSHTIQFVLAKPFPQFLYSLPFSQQPLHPPSIRPAPWWRDLHGWQFAWTSPQSRGGTRPPNRGNRMGR